MKSLIYNKEQLFTSISGIAAVAQQSDATMEEVAQIAAVGKKVANNLFNVSEGFNNLVKELEHSISEFKF